MTPYQVIKLYLSNESLNHITDSDIAETIKLSAKTFGYFDHYPSLPKKT